jgi:hypothetical protein
MIVLKYENVFYAESFKTNNKIVVKSNIKNIDDRVLSIEFCPEDIIDIKALYGVDLEKSIKEFCRNYMFYKESLLEGKTKDQLSEY